MSKTLDSSKTLHPSTSRLVEVNEPPTLATLARLCQYELALSAGQEKTVRPVSWHEKLLMHFFDMPVKSA